MELRVLRYFLAVVQEQSITKAAERLYIAQPSLSKQMQSLEKEIGRPLFLRGSRKITLTETGLLLKKRAEEMVELYEKTQAELRIPNGEISGEVAIGGGESHAVITIARAACEVQKLCPAVRFRFFSGDADDILEKLDKGLFDFGVVVDVPDISRYHSLRLPLADEWGVLMRDDSPLAANESITKEDLRNKPLLCSMQSLRRGSQLRAWFGEGETDMDLKEQYNLLYNASLFVKAGMGYAVGLGNIVNTAGESGLCFKPLSPPLHTNLDLIWKKYDVFTKPAQLFLDCLRKVIAES